jgi:hypothetical protein
LLLQLFKYVTVIALSPDTIDGQNSSGGGSYSGGIGGLQSYIGGGISGRAQLSIKSKQTLSGDSGMHGFANSASSHTADDEEEVLICASAFCRNDSIRYV